MSISNGTLLKRGKYWPWEFRIEGEIRWKALEFTSKRDAELVRQQLIAKYHRNRAFVLGATLEFTGACRLGDIKQRDVERFKLTKRMPEFIEERDVEALLVAAEAHSREIHWVFLLGLHAGLRKGEIVNARWEWFDLANHGGPVIRMRRHDGFEIKDHEERSIPMSRKIADSLIPHRQSDGFLFGECPAGGNTWRYRDEPRRPFNAVKKASGVSRCTFNHAATQLRLMARHEGDRHLEGVSRAWAFKHSGHDGALRRLEGV